MPTARLLCDTLPPVSDDEALELCVHHLQLARIYWMNTSPDLQANLVEIERILAAQNEHDAYASAITGFFVTCDQIDEGLKD